MSCDQYKIKFDEDNYQIKQEITNPSTGLSLKKVSQSVLLIYLDKKSSF